jgi:hypothetical protein
MIYGKERLLLWIGYGLYYTVLWLDWLNFYRFHPVRTRALRQQCSV